MGSFQGVKQGKNRISLGFCCNADGSDKRPIAYVGQSAKPRAFGGKSPNTCGFQYWNNKKAWFNNGIMTEWLRAFDDDMRQQGRNVILLMDNFSAYKKALEAFTPTNVTCEFFEPNLTSHCQPLDQGIIRAFKAHFHIQKTRHTIVKLDSNAKDPWLLTIREAMTFAASAWVSVKAETCLNCFRHAGIMPGHPRTASASADDTALTGNLPQEANKDSDAWGVIMRAFDIERSIPDIIGDLERILGAEYKAENWQAAVNLTCYEDDEMREENRIAAGRMKDFSSSVAPSSTAPPPLVQPNNPTLAEVAELEAALGLARLASGCSSDAADRGVQELLSEVTEAQEVTQTEMMAFEDEQLMEEIINRVEDEGIKVIDTLSDNEDDDDDVIDESVSRYAGDLTDAALAEINTALDTLLTLGTARPEESFAAKLVPNLHAIKKWSQHMHFQLPRQQVSIKNYFGKQPAAVNKASLSQKVRGEAESTVEIE